MIKCGANKSADGKGLAPWIPKQFDSKEVSHSQGAAVPWVYGFSRFGTRCDESSVVFPGVGSFFVGFESETLVMLLPVSSLKKSGTKPGGVIGMLNGLSPAAASQFMAENARVMVLQEQEVLWVPYGMIPWMIGLGSDNRSHVVHVPVLSG